MSRKEDIIYATLELASVYGLRAVSLSQIADKLGIKKPSLYNHFKSKDEIISEMYVFLREQAQKINGASVSDYEALFEGKKLAEILMLYFEQYISFLNDKNIRLFFKVLYSERSTSSVAAKIMLDETQRMTGSVKSLFYALVVHGKMKNEDVDVAALSYAMTIHSLVDKQMDMQTASCSDNNVIFNEIEDYINWFSKRMEVIANE